MPIVSAIHKYGKEHFKIELLEELVEGIPQSEVDNKEISWGIKLNSLSPVGYNLKLGNGHGLMSDETKKKISLKNSGRKVSEETRKKLRESHLGYKVKEETKQKLSNLFKGQLPHINSIKYAREKNSKSYILKSPDGETVKVSNMKEFCKMKGLHPSNMSMMVNGKTPAYKGWILLDNLGYNR